MRPVAHVHRLAGIALLLALCGALALPSSASAQDGPSESDARPLVLVLYDPATETGAATRLEAELRAAGFETRRTELAADATPVAVRGLASLHEAFALVREPTESTPPVVWLRDPGGDYGLRQLDIAAGTSPTVAAFRVVEFLSARQLELELGIPDASAERSPGVGPGLRGGRAIADRVAALGAVLADMQTPPPPSALDAAPASLWAEAEESDGPLGIDIDLGAALLLSGIGAQGGPALRVGFTDEVTGLGLRFGLIGPGFGAAVATPSGEATLRQEIVALDVGLARIWAPVTLRPWFGFGVMHVVAEGDQIAEAWVPAAGAGLSASVALLPWLAARGEVGAFLATSRVEIRAAANERLSVGAPTMTSTLGLAITL